MWRRVNNLVNSLITYQTLSPDSRCRRQVSQWLQQRHPLTSKQWFEAFWQTENILEITTDFVYHAFSSYSGLPFAYVIPEDRLEEDLCWTNVCWFDWEMTFFLDVETQFQMDISGHFHYEKTTTIAEIVHFLDQHIRLRKGHSTN
ncbi:MAG: hypothetical protein VKL39_06715 [Leptolyngbyaceae bacterium]|nr:hypothetical protein [Leptolyngbyaceae bacterium]